MQKPQIEYITFNRDKEAIIIDNKYRIIIQILNTL